MARASARIKAQPAVEPEQEPEPPSPRIAKTAASAKTAANAKAKAAKAKASPQKPAPKRKAQKDEDASCDSCAEKDESSDDDEKPAKRRKTTAAPKSAAAAKPAAAAKGGKAAKAKPAADDMPLAARTAVTSLKHAMYIGAHVSGAGGVQNAIGNASSIGANAFALFLKSQRKWASPPLAADARAQFVSLAASHGYDAAAHLNRAHAATAAVVTVLENMAGAGNVVGTRFEDLRDVIALVDDKDRVGVCIDTCHAFAAGYDMRTPAAFAATMAAFDDIVGLRYLKALHLNDSKAPFDSHRDLHANIGTGFLGLRAFHSVVNYAPFAGLPMVLETPIDRKGPDGKSVEDRQVWADEIKLLESLIGMDAESDAFAALERELQDRGAAERQKIQDQVDKKTAKETKKAAPKKTAAKPRGRKKKAETDDESD
ncbi:hypothetical protein BN1708_011068 [Verticillium longisporum]|uniref:Xylose isomerase-like TIM barrel domain-containing protein n=1 Tax=Verticillium longisporum TaxID=100787 RepID=A0A0G4KWQ2_VERLO|nr:hypothetical protein BN1708_011068 [Verticillium longisporum]